MHYFFDFHSNKNKTDCYISNSNQFRACESILLSVSFIHRYISQDLWNYSNLTIQLYTVYVITTQIVYTNYVVNIRKNDLLKFTEPSIWPPSPNGLDLSPVDCAAYKNSSAEHSTLRFPAWTISMTECAPAGRSLTNKSSINLLITGVTN